METFEKSSVSPIFLLPKSPQVSPPEEILTMTEIKSQTCLKSFIQNNT